MPGPLRRAAVHIPDLLQPAAALDSDGVGSREGGQYAARHPGYVLAELPQTLSAE